MKLAAALILTATAAAPAVNDILARPQSCEQHISVQMRGCEVVHYYLCPAEVGSFARVEFYTPDGLDAVTHQTTDGYMLTHEGSAGDYALDFSTGSMSATPLNEVLQTGDGTFELNGIVWFIGMTRPVRISGRLTLENEPVMISGLSLKRIVREEAIDFPTPMPTVNGGTILYFNDVLGMSIDGEGLYPDNESDGEAAVIKKPAEILLPGTPGFESTRPTYDCDQTSSLLVPRKDEKA